MVNRIVEDFSIKVAKGKQLLLVIDDLDKLRNMDQVRSIFIDNLHFLLQIQCKKVIAVPVHLTGESEMALREYDKFGLSLRPNPLKPGADLAELETRKRLLANIVEQRTSAGKTLIETNAVEEAIAFSGGIIRQLMQILYGAAREARRNKTGKITVSHVQKSCGALKNIMEAAVITSSGINFLEKVRVQHIPDAESAEECNKALLGNQIIAYTNGSVWYDVNPLIAETVRTYAAARKD